MCKGYGSSLQLKVLSASLNSILPSHYRRAAAVDISEDLGNEHLGRMQVIRHRTITDWLNKDAIDRDEQAAAPPSKSGPKNGKQAKLETDVKDFLKDWLRDLPTVDSHYCRSTETYKDKKFLHPSTNISQLQQEYQQAAAIARVKFV